MKRTIIFVLLIMGMVQGGKISLDDLGSYGGVLELPRIPGHIWDEKGPVIIMNGSVDPGDAWIRVNLLTGDTTSFLDSSAFILEDGTGIFDKSIIASAVFSADFSKLLFGVNREKRWRRSSHADYYYLDLMTKKTFPVSRNNKRLRNVKFSPDGNKIAYVRDDNNIYVLNLDQKRERQLTRTGSDIILNGHLGWVYEEEFRLYDGYRWSPDSKYIAYYEEDQSKVPVYHMLDDVEGYPELISFRYPRAGEANPEVRIGVISVRAGRTKWLDTQVPEDHYLPFVKWKNTRELVVARMDRRQKKLTFMTMDIKSGQGLPGIVESDSVGWVDLEEDYYFLDNRKMLWVSEKSGYRHLATANLDGSNHRDLTAGKWETGNIVHVDEGSGKVWFMANRESVASRQLFSVNMDGTDLRLVTGDPGNHQIVFSPDGNFFIDTWSRFTNPRRIDLYAATGELVKTLGETDQSQIEEYAWSIPELISFPAADSSVMLDGVLIYPVDYKDGKKYPLIVHGYGMPGTQQVWNSWGSTLHQYLAQEGYFVFSMDSRGMSGRGEAFKNLSYGNMARYLAPDQSAGVRHLISRGLIDENRVGTWGSSGGGYFTALMLTLNSSLYKVGVAVAPVTDFRLYDTIYTERSMGLPEENQSGYDSTSVFTWLDRLSGNLLLLHGTMDDNVHTQNTTMLFDRAVETGKHVDMYLYPGRNHGIHGRGARGHVYRTLVKYFNDNL